jgi:thioredoxin-dependent peroxiredoxin
MLSRRLPRALAALGLALPALLHAQAPAAPAATGPAVGDMAPAFTIQAIGKTGAARPVTLASLRGKTVVLAFFPRVRTSGCTAQMHAYRDRFADIFGTSGNVTLIAISTDSAAAQQSWAQSDNLPMLFGSDVDGAVGTAYGAFDATRRYDRRMLYVIAPDGKISYTAKPFRELVEASYGELTQAVRHASGAHSGH